MVQAKMLEGRGCLFINSLVRAMVWFPISMVNDSMLYFGKASPELDGELGHWTCFFWGCYFAVHLMEPIVSCTLTFALLMCIASH